jgi:hypothetical protein
LPENDLAKRGAINRPAARLLDAAGLCPYPIPSAGSHPYWTLRKRGTQEKVRPLAREDRKQRKREGDGQPGMARAMVRIPSCPAFPCSRERKIKQAFQNMAGPTMRRLA